MLAFSERSLDVRDLLSAQSDSPNYYRFNVAWLWAWCALATLVCMLRLWIRAKIFASWAFDDWLMLVGAVSTSGKELTVVSSQTNT